METEHKNLTRAEDKMWPSARRCPGCIGRKELPGSVRTKEKRRVLHRLGCYPSILYLLGFAARGSPLNRGVAEAVNWLYR